MRLEAAVVRQAAQGRLRAVRKRPRLHLAIVVLPQRGRGLLLQLVLGHRVGQLERPLLLLPVRGLWLVVFLGRLYKRRSILVASFHWGCPNWACFLPLRVYVIH